MALALAPLLPAWPGGADIPGVGAAMSRRAGGFSQGRWASLNLGVAVGDDPAHVALNRQRFAQALGARPVWLRQVHGTQVLRLHAQTPEHPPMPADAAWTTEPHIACTVQVADCLPALFALRDGSAVAAAHAGWRGLAAGVLEAAVSALCQGTGAQAADIQAWLGPCIGPRQFEVGADVLLALGHAPSTIDMQPEIQRFVPRQHADGSQRWLANLPLLAHDRLAAAGVRHIARADICTVECASHFFSFRRDGVTGRMAAAIWRR